MQHYYVTFYWKFYVFYVHLLLNLDSKHYFSEHFTTYSVFIQKYLLSIYVWTTTVHIWCAVHALYSLGCQTSVVSFITMSWFIINSLPHAVLYIIFPPPVHSHTLREPRCTWTPVSSGSGTSSKWLTQLNDVPEQQCKKHSVFKLEQIGVCIVS